MSADTWTGRVIDNRYVVEAMLGQGGMGVVLKARHKFTGAEVALKMLKPDMLVNEQAKERFLGEARTPTSIGHPGIVQVMDAGTTPEGELYIAMELLVGKTLRQAMYPPMPPQIARRILLELLDALGAAHTRGIIHRDLKPENVFLVGAAGTVKLLDFGIAKVVQLGRTQAGMMLGTLSYMAPEQLSDASSVDPRADLWAVGVMVYEMVTGKLPFRGTQLAEIMTALATQEPDPIKAYVPQATPAMEQFFAKALSKDRNNRYASAQDMAMGVSSMLLEGTAPIGSTLTGLGPKSNVMTAADSGPQIPSRQFGAPSPAVSTAQPVTSPTPAPFAPHVPPPSNPTPAPMTPSAPPFTAPPAMPTGNQWAQGHGFVNDLPEKKKGGGFDKTSWIVIGGVVVAMAIVIVVYTMKSNSVKQGFEDCSTTCETLAKCSSEIDDALCTIKCGIEPKTETCVEESGGSCEVFAACIQRVGGKMPNSQFEPSDTDNGLELEPASP